jgi:hypothetical protein
MPTIVPGVVDSVGSVSGRAWTSTGSFPPADHRAVDAQALPADRFTAFACLAEEWQQAAEQGLGDQDLTVVARVLAQQGGAP